ncbi:LacI family DNA-binding transcriptional regulator [Bifidobacterium oedipodis]|uniref:LacI family transcriptional regulator n=1 Tax=Bifidobacterium oedipodis TaxID=2675322 RepID=A0A7Y0EQH6_9BIFI|nr:LacI family DNA-binding transcriptional regulator [Bifidobacterium sp. DSM 109957]NMM94596.1 LacI family transcriptional regulator [Bifidobacterium sp. DSM 109957]
MGNRTTTLRDVAKEAGVSPMTASNALHGKPGVKESTRAKVLAAAKKLNYRINLTASMLKSGRSNIIHIVVNEFDSPFYAKLVQSLSNETKARGLTPFFEDTCYSPDAAKRALTSTPFSAQLFDGEILHASGLSHDAPIDMLTGGRPFVLIDSCEDQPTTDQVNFPNEEGARAAVQHLAERGCKRIALVGDPFRPRAELARAASSGLLRLRGASGALLDAGLPYDQSVVFNAYNADAGRAVGHAIADANSQGAGFDGICCVNDYAACGVLRGLADRGVRVPDDIKIIGFDGVSSNSYAVPTLSTIQVDFQQLARLTLDMLVRRIEQRSNGGHEDPPARATIGYQLIARESTGQTAG